MATMDKKLLHAKSKYILWLDLEMTGLDTRVDTILEVGAIITDWNFKEIGTFEAVVHRSDHVLETMNEWCIKQHGASGLTQKVRESTLTSDEVEAQLLAFVDEHFDKHIPVLLGGNSIHMDRRFIGAEWPNLDKRLHYRMLDVSAWKVVFEAKFGKKFAKPEEHRALDDIRGSIIELQYYLGKVSV
jgi:oligoribonuclease